MARSRSRQALRRFRRDEAGGSAAELVLIMIPLIGLTLGTINLAMMIYTVASLHYATEEAARCATVRPTLCPSGTGANATTFRTQALTNYAGLTASPTFTLTVQPKTATVCPLGNYVTATANYHFVTGFTTTTIPLTANACYSLP
jgi:Flp pilus assembly protein TadG